MTLLPLVMLVVVGAGFVAGIVSGIQAHIKAKQEVEKRHVQDG